MGRRIVAYGIVGLVVLPIPLGALWLLAQAEPAGYTRPTDYTVKQIERQAAQFITASNKVANTLADKSNQTPLDVTFTDEMINGHIRSRPQKDLAGLPPWLTNPQLVFTSEAVVLMADVDVNNVQAVLSVHVVPEVTGDGRLTLRMSSMYAGRLPLPDAVRGAMIEHAEQRAAKLESRLGKLDEKTDRKRFRAAEMELEVIRAALGLCRGEEIVADTRRFHLSLEALELQPKRLRIVGSRVQKPPKPDAG